MSNSVWQDRLKVVPHSASNPADYQPSSQVYTPYQDSEIWFMRHDQLQKPTKAVSWNNQQLSNLADPVSAQDAATKAYMGAGIAYGMLNRLGVIWSIEGVDIVNGGAHLYGANVDWTVAGSGVFTPTPSSQQINTGGTNLSQCFITRANLIVGGSGLISTRWDRKIGFKVTCVFHTIVGQYIHIVVGDQLTATEIGGSGNTLRHIGFKVVEATLSATVANGTTESASTIATLSASDVYSLLCFYDPDLNQAQFYYRIKTDTAWQTGPLITTNLPDSTNYPSHLFQASIYKNEGAGAFSKYLTFAEAIVATDEM